MLYLSECFWRHFFDVCSLAQNIYEFLACLSVCLLAQVLDEIFGRHSWDVCELNRNKYISLVCLCVFLTFTSIGWVYILTFECLYSGINFDPSGLVTFLFSEGPLRRPLVLLLMILFYFKILSVRRLPHVQFFSKWKAW